MRECFLIFSSSTDDLPVDSCLPDLDVVDKPAIHMRHKVESIGHIHYGSQMWLWGFQSSLNMMMYSMFTRRKQ